MNGFWSTIDFHNSICEIIPRWEDRADITDANYRESSIELSLGSEAFVSSQKQLKILRKDDDTIKIEPGDFALLITKEYIKIPVNCMGFISIKSKHKLSGLINISGFHVDPGFEGKLKFSVYNAGTNAVVLRYATPTFILFITGVNDGVKAKAGVHWKQEHIEASEMMPLLGTGIPAHDLSRRVGNLETIIKIYSGVLVGIFLLLLKGAIG